jgi:hypothetical protein
MIEKISTLIYKPQKKKRFEIDALTAHAAAHGQIPVVLTS